MSDQEGVQVEVTRLLVASYFDIVRKNLQVRGASVPGRAPAGGLVWAALARLAGRPFWRASGV